MRRRCCVAARRANRDDQLAVLRQLVEQLAARDAYGALLEAATALATATGDADPLLEHFLLSSLSGISSSSGRRPARPRS